MKIYIYGLIAVLYAVLIPLLVLYFKRDKEEMLANRKEAEDMVDEVILQLGWPNRQRWVSSPEGGDMIQFIFLLLASSDSTKISGHIIWLEVTIERSSSSVTIFHVPNSRVHMPYIFRLKDVFEERHWKVSIKETDGQPDLTKTGVRS